MCALTPPIALEQIGLRYRWRNCQPLFTLYVCYAQSDSRVLFIGEQTAFYALGIKLSGHATTVEVQAAAKARAETREAKHNFRLVGIHTPSHIGFPPHACADVVAIMGRTIKHLSPDVANLLGLVTTVLPVDSQPTNFSFSHALQWTVIDESVDEMMVPFKARKSKDVGLCNCQRWPFIPRRRESWHQY